MSSPADLSKRHLVVYGAFKGMGDLLCAAPVILSELNAGVRVILLIFPQLRGFPELIDFGPNRELLQIRVLPVSGKPADLLGFVRDTAALTPDLVWYSPHAPLVASSWRIPLLLWVTKTRNWRRAVLAGADSERLSWLFDVRVPVDRRLPYETREWVAYSLLLNREPELAPPRIAFKPSIQASRELPPLYDLVCHPGAGADNRKWPYERYAELIQHLPAQYRIAVVGVEKDVAALRAILPAGRQIVFSSGTLEDAIVCMGRARAALTMDSGTLYFANILGVPAVTLFGPSDPATVVPPRSTITPVYDVKWPCQPCANKHCFQKSLYCMESIAPERVARELLRLLTQHEA